MFIHSRKSVYCGLNFIAEGKGKLVIRIAGLDTGIIRT